MILQVDRVSKKFGSTQAVNDVSFVVEQGKIVGLLGPNGAGKTTLIRMIMDIYQPDEGRIKLGVDAKDRKNHIGCLPEERGLYGKVKVREALIYFAMLKGLNRKAAIERTQSYLQLLEMQATADVQISKLSKGNQQKIQIISAMVSDPELLIFDEPFSGLDPVNTKMIAECIRTLKSKGVTILLSTHQMNQAETFCDTIFLFNKGRLILEGVLKDIIQRYSGQDWMITTEGDLSNADLFHVVSREQDVTRITLSPTVHIRQVMAWLAEQSFAVSGIQQYRIPLSEIFIREVAAHG